jgi:hypothetical protein
MARELVMRMVLEWAKVMAKGLVKGAAIGLARGPAKMKAAAGSAGLILLCTERTAVAMAGERGDVAVKARLLLLLLGARDGDFVEQSPLLLL